MSETAKLFEQLLTDVMLGPDGDVTAPPPSEYGKARASAIGSGCLRQVQYIAYQTPRSEPPTESGRLATNEGQTLELLAKHWIRNIPGVAEVDSPPAIDIPLTATPDVFILWNGKIHLVEIKFMGYYRFSDLLQAGDVRAAHAQYYWQAIAQLQVFPEADSVLFVAFPFDYGAVKGKMNMRPKKGEPPPKLPPIKYVEEIRRDSASEAALLDIANLVKDTPSDQLLPRGYRPGIIGEKPANWQCAYCDYLSLCRADG